MAKAGPVYKQRFLKARKGLPPSRRGLAFDLASLVLNILLVKIFSRQMGALIKQTFGSDDPTAARQLGLILLFAFVAQMVGAYFKRYPLQARLAARRVNDSSEPFGCFLVLHFALSLIIFATIVAALPIGPSPAVIVPGFFFCIIPTALVYRAMTPPKQKPVSSWRLNPRLETVADIALFAYMLVNLSFLNFVTAAVHPAPLSGFGEFFARVAGGVILLPLLLMYYICPRLLFLVEDYRYPVTWISMTIALLPVAIRFVFG